MKTIINRSIIIIVIAILTVLTSILFSNSIKANDDADKNATVLSDIYTTGGLARFIANYSSKIWDSTIQNLFNINVRTTTTPGLSIDNKAGEAIGYHSAACMFHALSTETNNDNKHMIIQNIIEIEAPGNVKVYKYTRCIKW